MKNFIKLGLLLGVGFVANLFCSEPIEISVQIGNNAQQVLTMKVQNPVNLKSLREAAFLGAGLNKFIKKSANASDYELQSASGTVYGDGSRRLQNKTVFYLKDKWEGLRR
jgi:hypothetical protein